MKNWWDKLRSIRIQQVDIGQISDKALLMNLYFTQAATLVIGIIVLLFQGRSLFELLLWPQGYTWLWWGAGLAAAVLVFDLLVSRWVPEDVVDDGGVNERIFGNRVVWHIALISLVVAICEEILFRGAIQHAWGPYWTSVFFAAIHVRYLRHWLMTGLVFLISYGLGKVYEWTGTLWAPITAHFFIDFVMGCILRFRKEKDV